MKFPFHLIIQYAHTKPDEVERAYPEFFGNMDYTKITSEHVKALFFEWLMYEFKQKSSLTFMVEYTLKNPDNLPLDKIGQFKQIWETHRYSEFQIIDIHPPIFMTLEDVFGGKSYDVFDTLGSLNIQKHGVIKGRIAKIDGKWYLVGSNPIYFPMSYTPRMKMIMQKDIKYKPSVQDTAQLLLEHEAAGPRQIPDIPTPEEIKAKKLYLKKAYTDAAKRLQTILTIDELIRKIYTENNVNVLDFWSNLINDGLSEKFLTEETQILEDIWNFFPHESLKGLSPIEMLAKFKSKRKLSKL